MNGSYINSVRICPICDEQIPNIRSKRANQRCNLACDKKYKSKIVRLYARSVVIFNGFL